MTEITITYKKLLELNGQIDHNNLISVKYIPKVIDYDSFIKIISSDSLCYISPSKWKHMINNIDGNNNTFPLFWACYYRNFKTIMLLIKNGSIYSPYHLPSVKYEKLEYNMNLSRVDICRTIIIKLKKYSIKYFKISFKKFCNAELNKNDLYLYNNVNDYTEVIKTLVNQFPDFINQNDNFNNILYFLHYNYFDISEILLSNANVEALKKVIMEFNTIFNNFYKIYDGFTLTDDYLIFMKEYYRYRILSMIKFIKKKLIDKNILNNEAKILEFDKLIKKKFGTFEIHDSIFYKLYFDENGFENKKEVSKKFNDLGSENNDFIPVNDHYTGIMCLKTLSEFQNDELEYDKPEKIYNRICSKFEDYSMISMMEF